MELSNGRNFLLDQPAPGVWVVRFTRPDPRFQLDGAGVEDCDLYHDLRSEVLSRLAPGEALVLNFALVHYFPTAFYQVLLQVREGVVKRKARMILCAFSPDIQESIRLFKGDKLFEIVSSEEHAVRQCSHPVPAGRY
jgi:anti-anti-sigma regulatory factor